MKNMAKYSIIGVVGLTLLVGLVYSKQNTLPSSAEHNNVSNVNIAPGAGPVVSTDPQDIVPGTYPDLISNTATTSGLMAPSGLVENNVDAQGRATDDHLEVLLKNTSTHEMSDFEVYYTIADLTTGISEGYYKKLTGFVLKSGESKSIHFDGKASVDHYGVNKDGLYFTSKNKLQFDIRVSTPGFQVVHLQILKDAGGAEAKD
jgi:hypothetical protein